jgi:cell division septal protein FtsQ
LGLTRAYLFLINSDAFRVSKTSIVCGRDFVERDIRALLQASRLDNLFLLDIDRLKERIEAHRWVREARLRKVFPSTIKIEIAEREPSAVLKIGQSYLLIDREGVYLERLAAPEDANLPLLHDSGSFQTDYREKLALAWDCLESLTPAQRAEVVGLDLSENRSVAVFLRGLETRLILGSERFAERLEAFRVERPELEAQFGPLEYVNLSFDDRTYLKPLPAAQTARPPNPPEEVN